MLVLFSFIKLSMKGGNMDNKLNTNNNKIIKEEKADNQKPKKDNKIVLNVNNRKHLMLYINKYKSKNKLAKKIDIDEKLVYKFENIQDYLLVAMIKAMVDEINFELIMETQKIKMGG